MIARRRLLLALPCIAGLPALGGCGWEPLYADPQTATANADLCAIKVDRIAERVGQMLEFGLRDSLNPAREATPTLYHLRVTLQTALASRGIQSQGLGTRGEVQASANYQLFEIKGEKLLLNGSVSANDSFDIQANGYSTLVAEDDAKRRAVEEIRREIVARLTLFMQNRAPTAS